MEESAQPVVEGLGSRASLVSVGTTEAAGEAPLTPAPERAEVGETYDNTGSAARQGRPRGLGKHAEQARRFPTTRGPSGFTTNPHPDQFRRPYFTVSRKKQRATTMLTVIYSLTKKRIYLP